MSSTESAESLALLPSGTRLFCFECGRQKVCSVTCKKKRPSLYALFLWADSQMDRVWFVRLLIISLFARMKTAVSLTYSTEQKGDDVQNLRKKNRNGHLDTLAVRVD